MYKKMINDLNAALTVERKTIDEQQTVIPPLLTAISETQVF